MMIARRDADSAGLKAPILRLVYGEVLRDPAAAVGAIIAFAGLRPRPEQIAAAAGHVDSRRQNSGKTTDR